jgi:hypothetical protein
MEGGGGGRKKFSIALALLHLGPQRSILLHLGNVRGKYTKQSKIAVA